MFWRPQDLSRHSSAILNYDRHKDLLTIRIRYAEDIQTFPETNYTRRLEPTGPTCSTKREWGAIEIGQDGRVHRLEVCSASQKCLPKSTSYTELWSLIFRFVGGHAADAAEALVTGHLSIIVTVKDRRRIEPGGSQYFQALLDEVDDLADVPAAE